MDLKSLKRIDRSSTEDLYGLRRRRTSEWSTRVEVPEEDEEESKGIMSQMYHYISLFCRDVLHSITDSKVQQTEPMSMSLYRLLNSVYTSFITWGDDFEVGSGNLDDALKDSQDLRQFTIEIMMRICETLTTDLLPPVLQILKAAYLEREQDFPVQKLRAKAKDVEFIREQATMHVESNPDDDKPSDDGDSTIAPSDNSSLEDVLENLKSDVEALIELGPCLEDPIQDNLVPEAAASPPRLTADNYKYQTFFEGIKQKFPQCDDDLARALSKAFYDTTMRLQRQRQMPSCESVEQLEVTGNLPKDSGYQTSLRELSRKPESFHDSGIATASSYASSLASYTDGEDGTARTPFPSQPKDLKIGENFGCVACGRQVAKSESGAAWRRHLLSDLRPWICCQVSCGCLRTPYHTRDEWLKHLQAQHEVHPHWDDKKCPFCLRFIAAGGREMIRHVERHLRLLSLAALTANPEEGDEDSESEHSDASSPGDGDAGSVGSKQPREIEPLKDHPLYTHAVQGDDGLWHCPWEGEGYCVHKPSVLRADFDKFVMFHFESLRCKVEGCDWSGRAFATQEIKYLHEQKEHDMHKGGGQLLCTSPGCGRSRPGNGFANRWIQLEHIKRVHENLDLPPLPDDD